MLSIIMHAATALIGTIVLCLALTANFFRTAWRLGILRAFGRKALSWRTWIAGALAACLPVSGAMAAMVIIPSDGPDSILPISAAELAVQLAAAGMVMHLINDKLMHWGKKLP